jgi:hypothetical protein
VGVVGTMTVSGMEGDGVITLLLGLAVVTLAATRYFTGKGWARWLAVGLGILGLVAAVYTISNIGNIAPHDFARVSVGTGLYVLGLGALLGAVGGVVRR